jgi:hypothetical protein
MNNFACAHTNIDDNFSIKNRLRNIGPGKDADYVLMAETIGCAILGDEKQK